VNINFTSALNIISRLQQRNFTEEGRCYATNIQSDDIGQTSELETTRFQTVGAVSLNLFCTTVGILRALYETNVQQVSSVGLVTLKK
jgi:hypothetical protein